MNLTRSLHFDDEAEDTLTLKEYRTMNNILKKLTNPVLVTTRTINIVDEIKK